MFVEICFNLLPAMEHQYMGKKRSFDHVIRNFEDNEYPFKLYKLLYKLSGLSLMFRKC